MSRIDEIITCAKSYQNQVDGYHDLYCDHGKVGLGLLDTGKPIVFNDRLPHLIDSLKKDFGDTSNLSFSTELAQDLQFKPNSMIIAAGVGGLLMIECFKSWQQKHDTQLWQSLIFLLCPAYYDIELRAYLNKHAFHVLDEWIYKDRSHFYDIQVVTADKIGRRVGLLPELPDRENGAFFREFCQKQLKRLRKKRFPSEDDLWLIEQYEAVSIK